MKESYRAILFSQTKMSVVIPMFSWFDCRVCLSTLDLMDVFVLSFEDCLDACRSFIYSLGRYVCNFSQVLILYL